MGLTHLFQHEIDTGDTYPIKTCCYHCHLYLAHQVSADIALDEVLRAGIIELRHPLDLDGCDAQQEKESEDEVLCQLQTA